MKPFVFLFISITQLANLKCNKDPLPPNTNEIVLFQKFTFIADPSGKFLTSKVFAYSDVQIPNPDCDHTGIGRIYWQMTDQDEYIDITLFDHAGVVPGILGERGYTLLGFDAQNNQTYYFDLIMRQSPKATDKLYQMTWRLKINANVTVPPENELGKGLISPAPGESPYEREFEANKLIGDHWMVKIPANVNPDYITATITYHLHKLNYVHCN